MCRQGFFNILAFLTIFLGSFASVPLWAMYSPPPPGYGGYPGGGYPAPGYGAHAGFQPLKPLSMLPPQPHLQPGYNAPGVGAYGYPGGGYYPPAYGHASGYGVPAGLQPIPLLPMLPPSDIQPGDVGAYGFPVEPPAPAPAGSPEPFRAALDQRLTTMTFDDVLKKSVSVTLAQLQAVLTLNGQGCYQPATKIEDGSQDATKQLGFYETSNPYYEFANTWRADQPLENGRQPSSIDLGLEGQFPSSEHFFQCGKFVIGGQGYNNILAQHSGRAVQLAGGKNAQGPPTERAGQEWTEKKTIPGTRSNSQFLTLPDWMPGAEIFDEMYKHFNAYKTHFDVLLKYATNFNPYLLSPQNQTKTRLECLKDKWQETRVCMMWKALVAKFTQNDRLKQLLLGTGRAYIYENSYPDYIWGSPDVASIALGKSRDKFTGTDEAYAQKYFAEFYPGLNMLGFMLMIVREFLRAEIALQEEDKKIPIPVAPAAPAAAPAAPAPAVVTPIAHAAPAVPPVATPPLPEATPPAPKNYLEFVQELKEIRLGDESEGIILGEADWKEVSQDGWSGLEKYTPRDAVYRFNNTCWYGDPARGYLARFDGDFFQGHFSVLYKNGSRVENEYPPGITPPEKKILSFGQITLTMTADDVGWKDSYDNFWTFQYSPNSTTLQWFYWIPDAAGKPLRAFGYTASAGASEKTSIVHKIDECVLQPGGLKHQNFVKLKDIATITLVDKKYSFTANSPFGLGSEQIPIPAYGFVWKTAEHLIQALKFKKFSPYYIALLTGINHDSSSSAPFNNQLIDNAVQAVDYARYYPTFWRKDYYKNALFEGIEDSEKHFYDALPRLDSEAPAPFYDTRVAMPSVEQLKELLKKIVPNDSWHTTLLDVTYVLDEQSGEKQLYQSREKFLEQFWPVVSVRLRYKICYEKFKSDPSLKYLLLKTGDHYLEGHDIDFFWGGSIAHSSGQGLNMLGIILMAVRHQIKIEERASLAQQLSQYRAVFAAADGNLAQLRQDPISNIISQGQDVSEQEAAQGKVSTYHTWIPIQGWTNSDSSLPQQLILQNSDVSSNVYRAGPDDAYLLFGNYAQGYLMTIDVNNHLWIYDQDGTRTDCDHATTGKIDLPLPPIPAQAPMLLSMIPLQQMPLSNDSRALQKWLQDYNLSLNNSQLFVNENKDNDRWKNYPGWQNIQVHKVIPGLFRASGNPWYGLPALGYLVCLDGDNATVKLRGPQGIIIDADLTKPFDAAREVINASRPLNIPVSASNLLEALQVKLWSVRVALGLLQSRLAALGIMITRLKQRLTLLSGGALPAHAGGFAPAAAPGAGAGGAGVKALTAGDQVDMTPEQEADWKGWIFTKVNPKTNSKETYPKIVIDKALQYSKFFSWRGADEAASWIWGPVGDPDDPTRQVASQQHVSVASLDDIRIAVVNGNITNITTQFLDTTKSAIVNAANESLAGGGGIDAAIHGAAGPMLRQWNINYVAQCPVGCARISPGFEKLQATKIISVTGPRGTPTNKQQLKDTYQNALRVADNYGITQISFCAISAGLFGGDLIELTPLALNAVVEYLKTHTQGAKKTCIREVRFIAFPGKQTEYQYFRTFFPQQTAVLTEVYNGETQSGSLAATDPLIGCLNNFAQPIAGFSGKPFFIFKIKP